MKTVFGLLLLAAELLKSGERTSSAERQRKTVPIPKAVLRGMKAAETTAVAFWAAINVTLLALWANSMANIYAHDDDARCGALAMANFSAGCVRIVLLATGIVWAGSIILRWLTKRTKQVAFGVLQFVWVAYLGFYLASEFVFLGQRIVERLPVRLPPLLLDDPVACREFLWGPNPPVFQWLERHMMTFPKGF